MARHIYLNHIMTISKNSKNKQIKIVAVDSFCYLAIHIEYKDKPSYEEVDIYFNHKLVSL